MNKGGYLAPIATYAIWPNGSAAAAGASIQGAVSSVSLGSTDFLQYIEPLPMDQLLYHDVQAVRAWPEAARDEILAVAQRDVVTVTLTREF